MSLRLLKSFYIYPFIALVIFVVGLPLKTFAASPSSISVNVEPQNPTPGQNTTITLSSYDSNLDTVLISWSVNGRVNSSGIGQKTFSLNAPAAGSETTVIATLSLPDGKLDERIIVRPSMMVLLWQADNSYVPPFYRGKALPTPNSEIKVVALPEINNGSSLVDPTTMSYDWQKDYTNDPNGSGYGKNFYIYDSDYLDSSNNIGVTASTVDQNYSSQGYLNITTSNPTISFYKDDPTLGVNWDNALIDPSNIQGSLIVFAAPYFIAPQILQTPDLVFNWAINGNPVDVPVYEKNIIPLQTSSGVTGTSNLGLQISNTDEIFETANKSININF